MARTGDLTVMGDVLYSGSVKPKRSIVLTAAGGWVSSVSGCATAATTTYSTNKIDVYSFAFDPTGQEHAQWTVVMPDSYDGSTVTAQFIWSSDASTTGAVIWGFQGVAYGDTETIDAAWGTAQTATDTRVSASAVHISPVTSAITLAGSPAGGELVQFRAYRDAANASDTYYSDAALVAVRVEWAASSESD